MSIAECKAFLSATKSLLPCPVHVVVDQRGDYCILSLIPHDIGSSQQRHQKETTVHTLFTEPNSQQCRLLSQQHAQQPHRKPKCKQPRSCHSFQQEQCRGSTSVKVFHQVKRATVPTLDTNLGLILCVAANLVCAQPSTFYTSVSSDVGAFRAQGSAKTC